jgi:hypothetical protein
MAADFGSPVAQNVNVNPTQGIQTLSDLINLQRSQQQLQTGQYQQATAKAQSQQETQTAQQRQRLSQFYQNFDFSAHTGSDGTLDLDKVFTNPQLQQAAGDDYPKVVSDMIAIKQKQLEAKQQLANLSGTLRDQFSSTVGSLRADPDVIQDNAQGRAKVHQAIADFGSTGGEDAQRVAGIYGPVIDHVPQGKLARVLSNFQLQAMDASTQAAKQAPDNINTGSSIRNVGPQSAGGNLGPQGDIPVGIPPAMHTFQDQAGNTWAYNPQHPGQATLVGQGGTVPGAGGGSAAPSRTKAPPTPAGSAATQPGAPSAPPVMGVGQKENAVASGLNDQDLSAQVRTAANKAPVTKNILNAIQTLAGDSYTGPGSADVAKAQTIISQALPGFKAAGDAATNRQLLGKYVEQLALQTAESAGASTDQARATVSAAIPDPDHMTPQAIKRAAQFIQSQTQIAQARGAVEQKYRTEHNGNSQGYGAVDAQFMQHVDPRAFDYISMPPAQRPQFLQQNFPDAASRQKFAQSLSVIDHYGGFNYVKGGASGNGG